MSNALEVLRLTTGEEPEYKLIDTETWNKCLALFTLMGRLSVELKFPIDDDRTTLAKMRRFLHEYEERK